MCGARPGIVRMSRFEISLAQAVMSEVTGSSGRALPESLRPRVMGLRRPDHMNKCCISPFLFASFLAKLGSGFLSPVVFVPFVEVTLSAEQAETLHKRSRACAHLL